MTTPCPYCRVALDISQPGEVTCPACRQDFTALANESGSHICRRCGTIGNPVAGDWSGGGGFLLQCGLIVATLVALAIFWPLAVVMLIGTIAFGLKRLRDQHALCPACGQRDLIPLGTPAGQQLAQTFRA